MRPKAETTFSSMKMTIAHRPRSRKKRKEGCAYVTAYNAVRVVANPPRLI